MADLTIWSSRITDWGNYMARKWKHSLVGLALVSATVAAPAAVSTAGAQTGWAGFAVETASSAVDGGAPSPAFGAATTEDLGGDGADIWDNNHAIASEALVDYAGNGAFASSQVAPQAGPGIGVDSHGSYFGDLDGDGDDDLIETAGRESGNRVFINNGGTLELQANTGLEAIDARGRSVLLVDIDGDDDLDALVANLDRTLINDDDGEPLEAAPSALYLNNGNGTSWTEVDDTNNAIFDENIRFVSLTSTGPGTDQVIITSNSFAFGLDTLQTGVSAPIAAVNPVRQSIGDEFDNFSNARDIALGDLDGDLDIEFVVARQQDRLAQLPNGDQATNGDGEEIPSLAGDLAIGLGQVGSGGPSSLEVVQDISSDLLADNCRAVSLADFDNDADLDIFGGCTFAEGEQDTNIVLINDGAGNFTLDSTSVPATAAQTAAVVVNVDINNDGWIDTYVGNGFDNDNAVDHIFVNQGGSNHFLQIDLDATSDDDAGAQVFVGTDKWQVRETGHRNHRGQDSSTLHFGLADQEELAPVEIQWPDGTFETCTIDGGVDQRVTITQGGENCVAQTETGLVAAVSTDPVIPTDPPAAATPTCATLDVTVNLANGDVPTEGDDVILGTPDDDVIDGLGGNDTICGLGGDDIINGGAGADRIVGAAGDDTLNGGDGFDQIFAGAGDDTVRGGTGNDTINGGDGIDNIFGENGNDRIMGGGGADVLNGDGGFDRVAGGNGNDLINGGTHDDELLGNLGLDRLNGDGGNDVLRGGFARDVFNGGAGNNDGCTLTDPNGVVETRISCEGGVFGR